MSEEIEKTGVILPIQCPKCGENIELSIDFSLVPPKKEEEIQEANIEE